MEEDRINYISLKSAIVKSSSLTAVLRTLDKIVIIIGLVILARLLKPYDFGLAFLAQTFVGFFDILRINVFDSALVYEREENQESYEVGFTADLIFSLLLFVILFFAAPIWGKFYNSDTLTFIVRLYGIIILTGSFIMISRTKLLKRLEFVKIGIINLLVTVIRMTSTVILAVLGFSFWSILYGSIIGYLFYIVFFNLAQPSKIGIRFDQKIVSKLVRYGKYILLINVAGYILSELSGIAVGKFAGIVAAGYFLVAYKWGFWTFNNIFTFLESILFPVYSKYQKDETIVNKIFYKTLRYGSVVAFPVSFGTFLLAREFTYVVLGHKWASIITPLKILCIAGVIQFLGYLTNPFLKGIGYVGAESKRIYLQLVLLAIFLYPLTHSLGVVGASIAMLLTSAITQAVFFFYSSRLLKISTLETIKNIFTPAFATIFMAFSIFLTRYLLSRMGTDERWGFGILILSGLIAYIMVIGLSMREEIKSEMGNFRLL